MSRSIRLPALLAAIAVVLGAILLATTRDAPHRTPSVPTASGPEPGVTIRPTDDLRDGQVVIVRGAGLPPGLELLVAPCGREAVEAGRFGSCDLDQAERTEVDDSGSFSVGYRVARSIRVLGEDLDCAEEACVLSVIRSSSTLVELARQPLSFEPAIPDPPALVVSPRSDLSARAALTVRASGFGERVEVSQCVTGPAVRAATGGLGDDWCDPATSTEVTTTDGAAELAVIAIRVHVGPDGRPLDCLAADHTCTVQVADERRQRRVRLWFDPARSAPAAPAVAVEPATGLTDRQSVTVLVADLLAGEYRLELCPTDPAASSGCAALGVGRIQGPVGVAALDVRVPRRIGGSDDAVDCAVPPGCVVRLAGPWPVEPSPGAAAAAVTFDPDAPLALPLAVAERQGSDVVVRALASPGVEPDLTACGPEGAAPCTPVAPPERAPDGAWTWRLDGDPGPACAAGCLLLIGSDPAYPPVAVAVPPPAGAT